MRIPEEERNNALNHIIAQGLTLAETEAYVERLLAPAPEKREVKQKCAIGDLRLFANSLSKMVNTMRQGGVQAVTRKSETETHVEYTVVITKP